MTTDTRDLQGEKFRDMATVARIYRQLGEPVPAGTYGPFVGSPDDAAAARVEREDEESYWHALLASPEVATEDA